MPVTQFGTAYTLNAGNTQYEYVRKHTWEVQIDAFDTILLAKNVTPPQWTVTQGTMRHWNTEVKYPVLAKVSDLKIDLYDAIAPGIVAELWTWYKQMFNPNTQQMGLCNAFKKQGQIFQYDPAGNLIRTITCTGLFPLNQPTSGELNYEGQDPVVISMMLSCDSSSYDGALASSGNVGNGG